VDEPPTTLPPISANRDFVPGSARAALISLLSLPTGRWQLDDAFR
jgi:hypothetical protein